MTPEQVDAVLNRLAEITVERAVAAEAAPDLGDPNPVNRRAGIDGPTVARLVARAQRIATTIEASVAPPRPRWLPLLLEHVAKANLGVQRAIGRADALGPEDTALLLIRVSDLVANLTQLTLRLSAEAAEQESDREGQQDDG
jgi:hypothetical protein